MAVYGRRLLLVLEVGGRGGGGGGVASSGLDGEVRLQLKVSTILDFNNLREKTFFFGKKNLKLMQLEISTIEQTQNLEINFEK